MGLLQPAVVLLLLLIVLCIAGHAVDGYNGRVIGKKEARIVLNELRKRHVSHVLKRSTDSELNSEIDEEETDVELAMIERELERYENELQNTEDKGPKEREAEGGEKLIQEALKGNVDPDSDVVNLLESMYVDEGSRHNQHPEGIENIASKKGKVFGDTHDGHRLTQQQIEELNQMNGGRKKNFLKSATLWTDNIIPYTIDSSLSTDQSNVDVLNKAIQQFTDYTCLKWVPYGSAEANKASYSTYIEFISGSGCWSYVGRVFDDKQQISLEDPGCVSVSTAVHEMTHAIGQEHEQSRNDRDNYVTMLWSNIQGGETNNNMAKSNTYDYNPYDYESVLQYSLTSFSTNGQPTIEFKDRRLDFLADSATGLMFYDIQDITDGYNCTAPCRGADGNTPLKQCQNGGFVLHTCNCHCPDGLTGDLCQSVRTDPAECGPGIITLADGESRTITSPNFNNGGPYPTGKECVWLVKVMPGKFVEMTIEEMDLTTAWSACDHWLEIQYNLIGQTGPRRCGKVRKETYVTALHGNPTLMLLKFDSAFASTATAGKGFNLTVSSMGGADITTSPATQNPSTLYPVTSFQTTLYPVTQFPTTQTSSPPVVDQDLHCTFETGTSCFLNNINNDDFDWQIQRNNTPSLDTGPSSAYEGQLYSYIETSGIRKDDVAILESHYIITTTTFCLSFAYHMYGATIGTLQVAIKSPNGDQILFSKQYAQGNKWIVTSVDVPPSNGKIQFIGIRGSGYWSDIAVDDIHFMAGSCNTVTSFPTQFPTTQTSSPSVEDQDLHCTFETGTSCFLNNINNDDFDWQIQSGNTPSLSTGPSSAYEGQLYSYIETSGKRKDDVAILESHYLITTTTFCLSFAYHMYGANIGSLQVALKSPNGDQYLLSKQNSQGDKWIVTSVDVPPSNGKIQFIGIRGNGYWGDIAVDDIHFVAGSCNTVIDCTSNPCGPNALCVQETSTTYRCDCHPGFTGVLCDVVLGHANCTFEKGEDCFLENSNLDDFDWLLNSGKTPTEYTGPHSAKQGSQYAYIETTGRLLGQKAMFVNKYTFESGDRCLTFAYLMYGKTVGTLRVLQKTNMNTIEIFSKSGEHSNYYADWKMASLDIYHHMNDTIVFEATRGKSFTGDIALDDIKYTNGRCACDQITCKNGGTCLNKQNGGFCQCPPDITGNRCEKKIGLMASCTFDDGPCFLTDINGQDTLDWRKAAWPTFDTFTGPSKPLDGFFAYIEASVGLKPGDNAIFSSATTSQLSLSGPSCLRFFYNMNGIEIGTLRVFAGERNSEQKVWSLSGNQNDHWIPVAVYIPPTNDLVIRIEAIRGKGYLSDIAIDTIELFDFPCPEVSLPASCTFEAKTDCFLKNDKTFDDFDWNVRDHPTSSDGTGPSRAAEGNFYAFIETTGRRKGDIATLERLLPVPADGKMCLTFEYHMFGKRMGSLEVLFRNTTVFYEFGQKGDKWNKVDLNLNGLSGTAVPMLQFTATRGCGFQSEVAIDNIQLYEGECVSLPVSCTFETLNIQDCFLKNDKKFDDFDWKVNDRPTSSGGTGPSRAAEGNVYAFVETIGRRKGDIATLERFVPVPADGKMCLTFEYHMFGRHMGSLEVLLQNTTVFYEFGDKGNKWNKAELNLNSSAVQMLQFTATRGCGFQSEVAIDNIQLYEGECAVPLPT
ncbi:MAM and LDL-receptor class A domain-containing protein 1-like isoform X1 [Crassostrea angulata]|uniref:MAM and LDL-receptor class A domain-containing protein 1-like isoform X1 n=1 Tax=Magallana angulata TaxID=2784310 RepID=UPI0022B12242|nr:MAM and LDL-receptor class A domain-containing protein 1-like isoform X1 [Crassostrea angulata]